MKNNSSIYQAKDLFSILIMFIFLEFFLICQLHGIIMILNQIYFVKGFFIMGAYKYVDEYMLLQYMLVISVTQNRWIVLNVLLMQIWIFEFRGIQGSYVFESTKCKCALVCVFIIFLHEECFLILCLVIWIVCRKHWLVFTEAVKKSYRYASW